MLFNDAQIFFICFRIKLLAVASLINFLELLWRMFVTLSAEFFLRHHRRRNQRLARVGNVLCQRRNFLNFLWELFLAARCFVTLYLLHNYAGCKRCSTHVIRSVRPQHHWPLSDLQILFHPSRETFAAFHSKLNHTGCKAWCRDEMKIWLIYDRKQHFSRGGPGHRTHRGRETKDQSG